MKRVIRIAAALLSVLTVLGCSVQAQIIDSDRDREKIQIIGEIETPSPTEENEQSGAVQTVAPEPTEVPTPEPTEIPTPEPTEVPTPEPTAVPTPEPTAVPTPEATGVPVPQSTASQETERTKAEANRTQAEKFCDTARSLLDVPYHLGGLKPEDGFDPRGFVYYCLKSVGVDAPRKTSKGYSEYESWQRVDSIDELQPGDLCFFMTPGNESVNIVCIYLGGGQIIYPSSGKGMVVTAKITSNYWTEAFVLARRVF